MNILGINGLGVSPAACILIDGRLAAMAEEERFNRIKGSFGLMPAKAARYCLEHTGLTLRDIDYIAFGWNAKRYRLYMPFFLLKTYALRAPKLQGPSNIYKALEELSKYQPANVKNLIKTMFRREGLGGDIPPVKFIPHHLSHAACSYYTSGYEEAYILVIDGSGEDKCTTVMQGIGSDIKQVKSFKIPDSLGWFYQSMTEYLGYTPNRHEGKIMALAAYGKISEIISTKLNKIISCQNNGSYRYNARYGYFGTHESGNVFSRQLVSLLGQPRYKGQAILEKHKSIARHAQLILEEIVKKLVMSISKQPDWNKKICISGGVGLNCKMNGIISGMDCVDKIFIPPFPNDAGTALGAALYLLKQKGFEPRFKMEHSCWGPSYNRQYIQKTLNKYRVNFREDNNIEKTVAENINQNKIVGWFRGRMEAGPRALGHRSILANPTESRMSDRVNTEVKNREKWRPFAPSMLYEKRHKYIEGHQDAPFMALSFRATETAEEKIPAVVHVDRTTRPHFVKKKVTPGYWRVVNEFSKISGEAAVLNTSFNNREEPIVCTPEDALKTFFTSGLDCLAIENFMVYKNSLL